MLTRDEILTVVVACPCASCDRALELLAELRAARPEAKVRVARPEDPIVSGLIVGAPSYLLGGRTVWLGNPSLDELISVMDNNGSCG